MITKINEIKIKNNGIIVGKVKNYSIKNSKNNAKYIEGILEDKTGNIKFKIFNEKEVEEFLKKRDKKENPGIKFEGNYQSKYKSFLVNKILDITEEEYLQYVKKKEKDLGNILKFYNSKKWDNNYFDYLYSRIIKENLEVLKELPYTIYKSYNYPGGMLERNFYFYNFVFNNAKTFIEMYEELDIELLEIAAILKDIPAKFLGIDVLKEGMENSFKLNDAGKLLSNEFLTANTISKYSEEFFDRLEEIINNIVVSKNNSIDDKDIESSKLEEKLNKLIEKRNLFVDFYKEIENLDNTNNKKEIKNKLTEIISNEKIICKLKLNQKDIENIKINVNKNNIIIKIKNNNLTLKELEEVIVNIGKEIKKEIEKTQEEIKKIKNEISEIYNKSEEILKVKRKELVKYKKDFIKLLHIIETSNYFFKESETNFPKFPEAYIFANSNFSFSNSSFFLQEYKTLKENTEGEDIFSNKLGRYLYI